MGEFIRHVKRPVKRLASRLDSLDIELEEGRDNDCIHCCINLRAGNPGAGVLEMTTDQLKAILTEAAALGCLRVHSAGDEPLFQS